MPVPALPSGLPLRCELFGPADPQRDVVEQFVRAAYAEHYGATLSRLPPWLFVLREPRKAVTAVAGLRPAKADSLFLEQYLDTPIEAAIAAAAAEPVARGDVVEVSNLAIARPGDARLLIQTLTLFLHRQRLRWVTFTAVSILRNVFHRLGLAPQPLGIADPTRLPDAGASWGSYYRHRPQVMYGDVRLGHRQLYGLPALAAASAALNAGGIRAWGLSR